MSNITMENTIDIDNSKTHVCRNCGELIEPDYIKSNPWSDVCRHCSVIFAGPDLVDDLD